MFEEIKVTPPVENAVLLRGDVVVNGTKRRTHQSRVYDYR